MSDTITKEMTFAEVLRQKPESVHVLRRYNLGCIGCMGAQNETIEQGARAHGLDPDELVKALNEGR
ncbi:MAG: DUF1858 domain-containing protein [Desulfuromonadia bacterium]